MESIRTRLLREHAELRRVFDELSNAVEGADAPTVVRVWTEFERALERHLCLEEEQLFPALELRHRAEVRRLREEHTWIRALVAELGLRADLHTLRKDVADALVAALTEHAEQEDRGLYAWADAELGAKGLRDRIVGNAGSVI
jgi:hemerythrin-like domain-containing protein